MMKWWCVRRRTVGAADKRCKGVIRDPIVIKWWNSRRRFRTSANINDSGWCVLTVASPRVENYRKTFHQRAMVPASLVASRSVVGRIG